MTSSLSESCPEDSQPSVPWLLPQFSPFETNETPSTGASVGCVEGPISGVRLTLSLHGEVQLSGCSEEEGVVEMRVSRYLQRECEDCCCLGTGPGGARDELMSRGEPQSDCGPGVVAVAMRDWRCRRECWECNYG